MRIHLPLAAALAAIAIVGSAEAQTLTGLNNTGTSNTEGATDPNYVVTSYTGGAPPSGTAPYPTTIVSLSAPSNQYFPYPYWAFNAGDTTAAWISPDGRNTTDPDEDGTYIYQTTFDITGSLHDVTGLLLSGVWSADNYAEGFDVNGTGYQATTGTPIAEPQCACNDLYAFDITIPVTDLHLGTNTMTFEVTNFGQDGGNPTGLYVDYDYADTGLVGNPNPSGQVPEPVSIALFGSGVAGAAAFRRRRKVTQKDLLGQ